MHWFSFLSQLTAWAANPSWAAVFHPGAALWPRTTQISLLSRLTENILYSTDPKRLSGWLFSNPQCSLCSHFTTFSKPKVACGSVSHTCSTVTLLNRQAFCVFHLFSPLSQYLPDFLALKIALLSVSTKHQHNAAPTVQRPISHKQFSTCSNYSKLLQ